jgi:hypothetical protein
MVKGSTSGERGKALSITLGEQIYRVRYSGQNSPHERFSITSADPIEGDWIVTMESDAGILPEAQALENILVKIKYRAMFSKQQTVNSP